MKVLGQALGWIGSLYAILVGAFFSFQPLGTTQIAPVHPEQPLPHLFLVQIGLPLGKSILIMAAALIFFGTVIFAIYKGCRMLLLGLTVILIVFNVLSLLSVGIFFLPASVLILLSTLVLWRTTN